MRFTILTLLIITLFACQQKESTSSSATKAPQLGEVNLEVSGLPAAQADFKKGLLYLHSFEYFDSMNAFKEAQAKDPNFGMAYWGELMSYNHGLWARQLYDEAQATLLRMGATPEERAQKLKTQLEKDLFQGMEILFGTGSKNDRDAAYRAHMASLYKKYPDNHEVATFYAISVIGGTDSSKQIEDYNKSATILAKVLEENPEHPGALHYFIHSRDYPEHAHLAADAADKYAKVAPDAAHALHMPSHIYIALGRWNDVIKSNIESWNASVHKHTDHPTKPTSYHALSWLHYSLLQKGEKELAKTLLYKMAAYCKANPTQQARVYLMAMKGAHMTETNDYKGEVAMINANIEDLNIAKKAGFFYLEGMKAIHHKSPEVLGQIIKKMQSDVYLASLNVGKDLILMCNANGSGSKPPTQKDIDMTNIMIKQLEAGLAELNGDSQKSLAILKEATAIEDKVSLVFGPPTVFKPVYEQYGEALAKQRRYAEAITAFDKTLEKHPKRLKSLQGKMMAAKIQGLEQQAEAIYAEIQDNLTKQTWKEII